MIFCILWLCNEPSPNLNNNSFFDHKLAIWAGFEGNTLCLLWDTLVGVAGQDKGPEQVESLKPSLPKTEFRCRVYDERLYPKLYSPSRPVPVPLRIEEDQRKGGTETEQDLVRSSWIQKPLQVPGFGLAFPKFQRGDSCS